MPTLQAGRSALADDADAVADWAGRRGVTGSEVVAARAGWTVAVVGTGRLGAVAVDVLAASGVGTVLLDDAREVRLGDVGVGGLREQHVGRRRDRAVGELAAGGYRDLRVAGPSDDAPDVVVLVVEEGLATLRTARLVAEGVPHLVVTVTGWGAVVGPFVLPGETACVHCVALHEGGAGSLHRRGAGPGDGDGRCADVGVAGGRESGPGLRTVGPPVLAPQPSTVAAVAGALVGAEVVAYLDGRRPATAGASIEVETLDAMPRLRGWSVHLRCGCTGMGDGPPVV